MPCSRTATLATNPNASPTSAEIGRRLWATRRALDWSLSEVEEKSEGHWKAVLVGAYERADRRPTAETLVALAAFYGVPASTLLPDGGGVPTVLNPATRGLLKTVRDAANELLAEDAAPADEVSPETRGELEQLLAEVREASAPRELVHQGR